MTPLMRVAKAGNNAGVQQELAGGAKVNELSRYDWTALMFAAREGHLEVVTTLLKANADPNVESIPVPSAAFATRGGYFETSALQEAIRGDHYSVAKSLISAGAKIDSTTAALAGGRGNISFLQYLDSQGANWNEPSGNALYASPLCAAASAGKLAGGAMADEARRRSQLER